MVEVDGRPFLDWLIAEVARFGFPRITLMAGYLGQTIMDRYHGTSVRDTRVEVLVEPEPLGTAGGLRLFAEHLEERFLLLNGDTRFDVNLLDLALHAGDALATLALRRDAPGARYGTVELDPAGLIRGFAARSPDRAGLSRWSRTSSPVSPPRSGCVARFMTAPSSTSASPRTWPRRRP
jgi:D-glycero-D-manno-heptose 1,7-bisphosphate phosphatase